MVRFRRDILQGFFRRLSPCHKSCFIAAIWGATLLTCPIAPAAARSESALNLLLHAAASAESHRIPISYATTRITKPKTRTGLVDYLAAENAVLSRGVTLNNNAALRLYEILGPAFCGNESLWEGAFEPFAFRQRWQRAVLSTWHLPQPAVSESRIISFTAFSHPWQSEMLPKEQNLIKRTMTIARAFFQHPWEARHPNRLVMQWLSANTGAITRVRAACKLRRFYIPVVVHGHTSGGGLLISATLDYFPAIPDLGFMLNADANANFHRGRMRRCQNDLLAAHRLARLLSQQGDLMCRYAAWSADSQACRGDIALVQSGELTQRSLAIYAAKLHRLPNFYPLQASLDILSRWDLLSFLQKCALEPKTRRRIIDEIGAPLRQVYFGVWPKQYFINSAILCNGLYDQEVAGFKLRGWLARITAIVNVSNRRNQLRKSRKPFERLVATFCTNPLRLAAVQARSRDWRRLDVLTIAIAEYRDDHSKFPDRLAQLAPKYLPTIPRDPFTGKPFRYTASPTGCTISSPGEFPPQLFPGSQLPQGPPIIVHLSLPPGKFSP